MPRPAKTVGKALKKKGFKSCGGDHKFYHLYVGDKKTIVHTKISHGEKEIGDPLLSAMAKQVYLTNQEFLKLVDCPLKQEEYIKLLIHQGKIDS